LKKVIECDGYFGCGCGVTDETEVSFDFDGSYVHAVGEKKTPTAT
jgi:hypothetical protein